MTKQELKDKLEALMNKTVVRKANQKLYSYNRVTKENLTRNATQEEKVKGTVVGYSAKLQNGDWKVKLTVAWEGASNGTTRFNGSKWNTTSKINLDSVVTVD